jgi:hypothetical protein
MSLNVCELKKMNGLRLILMNDKIDEAITKQCRINARNITGGKSNSVESIKRIITLELDKSNIDKELMRRINEN